MNEWIKKRWYIYLQWNITVIKKNEILPFSTTWMDIDGMVLSGECQTDKCHMWNIEINKQQKQVHKYRDCFDGCQIWGAYVCHQYINLPTSWNRLSVYISVSQGDYEWKRQFHECRKSGDRVRAHPDETPRGQHTHHSARHAIPEADCADFNRKWRCVVLIHQGDEREGLGPVEADKAQDVKTFLTPICFPSEQQRSWTAVGGQVTYCVS